MLGIVFLVIGGVMLALTVEDPEAIVAMQLFGMAVVVDLILRLLFGLLFRKCFGEMSNRYIVQDYGITSADLKRYAKTPVNTWIELPLDLDPLNESIVPETANGRNQSAFFEPLDSKGTFGHQHFISLADEASFGGPAANESLLEHSREQLRKTYEKLMENLNRSAE
jgi:hypothetical protein